MKAEKIIDALLHAGNVESAGTFSIEKGENVKEVLTRVNHPQAKDLWACKSPG